MLQPTQAGEDLPLGEVPVKKHFAGQMTLSGNILYGQKTGLGSCNLSIVRKSLETVAFQGFF